ncbi:acetate--CoA ligase [Lentimicrobium sp.]|uniref:acetate--CoA ligase family protein n=1 Tax=Lentimicrobium sp. TaxID=2034841 RepID=UPI002600FE0E|nr:acetate--CoA ligase [Lentimicrobium sp.]MCO5255384.1 acetate--CoA ligase family protein [Lentimicrobium sp.]MCO5261403.1 acetate--CoA ligase family protein [Lentimicrobium sp.]HPF63275.1 acetate--CoA ligase family protein [Lentimicrobium sp.]HPJ61686.1 acetate--CoA ligase family protein [Lentimicrobium sp.]HPR24895.1 acetate--CoA ligase family protein [Lentimicrobium sp.]
MINQQLINPRSIVVIGGSNDTTKPGGKVLKNLLEHHFSGDVYVTNPKEDEIQGIRCYRNPGDLPDCDLAILAIAARFCPETVELLARKKNTRAFIILSAGFHEESEAGALLEQQIVDTINSVNGCLIGPNCIGVMNHHHTSVFTTPIPKLDPKGIDFISGSGATAVFIMESAMPKGLSFSSVYSVGNSAQMGVEEVLQYLDESFDPETSSKVKLLYVESINKPDLLLKHASSLIRKGCRIAAIKSGSSSAGSRAASSHTGALASSDSAVDALFRKAGIVRVYGREELAAVASVFMHKPLTGKNIAIITHAGGPAVMLTDALSNNGLEVPHIDSPELLAKLLPGSSVANPIDFLATGTAGNLGDIIDFCDNKFDNIDAMAVIFGSPGLTEVYDVYKLLDEKMKTCRKPIYPVLPSVINVKNEIEYFLSLGRINFPDEVVFGNALAKVYNTPAPAAPAEHPAVNNAVIRRVVDEAESGYLSPDKVQQLLDAAGIPRAGEAVVTSREEAVDAAGTLGYPVVMKVVGPVHKSDVGGVVLDVMDAETVGREFDRMINIKDTTAILLQPMLSGTQIFAGAKCEPKFGHMILCGLGGIFIEVLKDVQSSLSPVSAAEASEMIKSLKSYKIIQGVRGQEGVNETAFADAIVRLSALCEAAPEIAEMDINPLLGNAKGVVAVDARIRIEK